MIIVKFKSIPASAKVNANATIKAGQVIALNADAEAVLCDGDAAGSVSRYIGIAGDQKSSMTPGQFTNRLHEYGDETLSSGKITVYKGVGEFYVDFEDVLADATVAVGDYLTPSGTAPGKLTTTGATAANAVALVIDDLAATEGYMPSGIPGVNSPLNGTPVKFALIQTLR